MNISHLDHLVLTTAHLEECLHFYHDILGMDLRHENERYALFFGTSKINIHTRPAEFLPAAANPATGALDLCFTVDAPIAAIAQELRASGVVPETDIVIRHGARGAMQSIYLRDPDGNLIELCSYVEKLERNEKHDNHSSQKTTLPHRPPACPAPPLWRGIRTGCAAKHGTRTGCRTEPPK